MKVKSVATIWSAGASNVFEDNQNSPDFEVEDDGGYNLFITLSGRGYKTALKINMLIK